MLSKVIDGIDIIIGKDVISRLGGVMIRDGRVVYGNMPACQVERKKALRTMAVEDVQVKEDMVEPMEVEEPKKVTKGC